jgi:hypothetical protein
MWNAIAVRKSLFGSGKDEAESPHVQAIPLPIRSGYCASPKLKAHQVWSTSASAGKDQRSDNKNAIQMQQFQKW